MRNSKHHVVRLNKAGKFEKTLYCCPSKQVANTIVKELRGIYGNRLRVVPCV